MRSLPTKDPWIVYNFLATDPVAMSQAENSSGSETHSPIQKGIRNRELLPSAFGLPRSRA
jgi:hypothetical protein